MASSVNPLTASGTGSTTTSQQSNQNSLATPSEGVFLNLLVAQIQNQDPLNPTDSTQFVSQLAQFSELEQVIAIRNDTDTLVTGSQASAATNTNSTGTGTTPPATNTNSSGTANTPATNGL